MITAGATPRVPWKVAWAVLALAILAPFAPANEVAMDPATVLDSLDPQHPRLMLKDDRLRELKERAKSDAILARYVEQVLARADRYLEKTPPVYDKRGPRLLHVSRDAVYRVYHLGLAWRWTGDDKYAAKAVEVLLAVCDFADWNPSHFLDTAEMSHAVGLGYDWLFDYLDEPTRERIRTRLVSLGLDPGLEVYADKSGWWPRSAYNWNQVCNGGLLAGALAIADEEPERAARIVVAAVESLPRALASYAPDGVWDEGPGYWHYATSYVAYGLAALRTALGSDFGLAEFDGMADTAYFPIDLTGPTGLYLNFADVGERSERRPMPCMFWLARTYDDGAIADAEHAVLAHEQANAEHVIWYVPPSGRERPARPLDRRFGGRVEVAVMCSAWDDPEALFVGVKAGFNQVNHGNLDLGNFEIDALGVRWARDLGRDNYNLPGYWDGRRGGKRWTYYRLAAESHSVPLVGGEGQDPMARAKMLRFESTEDAAFAVVDLTNAYDGFSSMTHRGVALVGGRRAVLVQDEFEIGEACEVVWGMTTDAEIDVGETGVATLRLDGKELIARVLSPPDATFLVESAEQEPPQARNKGVRRLLVRLAEVKGSPVRVTVLLSPTWPDGAAEPTATMLTPLAEW